MRLVLVFLSVALAVPVAAQHGDHAHGAASGAGLPAAEAEGLRTGAGMGLARSAETNHCPGPLHVLELADSLGLSDAQRVEAERLRAAMLAEAVPLGEQVLTVEGHLDALFAEGHATPEAVDRMTAHLGALRGRLRAAHLRAHVAMRAALSDEQVMEYDRLRGYGP